MGYSTLKSKYVHPDDAYMRTALLANILDRTNIISQTPSISSLSPPAWSYGNIRKYTSAGQPMASGGVPFFVTSKRAPGPILLIYTVPSTYAYHLNQQQTGGNCSVCMQPTAASLVHELHLQLYRKSPWFYCSIHYRLVIYTHHERHACLRPHIICHQVVSGSDLPE